MSVRKPWWTIHSNFAAAKDYAYTSGIILKQSDHCVNASVTLKPSLWPRDLFEQITEVQTAFNSVLDAISQDYDFMYQSLERIMKVDSFIKNIFDIYSEVKELGNVQTTVMDIFRADYLLSISDTNKLSVKQVEINVTGAGSPALLVRMNDFHEYVQSRFLPRDEPKLVPHDNPALIHVNDALARAWSEYNNECAQVLFVVEEDAKNIFEQRIMEQDLFKRHKIKVFRKTLTEIAKEGRLEQDRTLIIDDIEVAVINYRAGGQPTDYPTDKEWAARRMMELSRATNCPPVAYQLVGYKKIQQVLATRGNLEKFCHDPELVNAMRATFAGHYTLDHTPEGDAATKLALENPYNYVMKPQREGGGNNLFDDELYSTLSKIASSPEREFYVLMDRIHSPAIPNAVILFGGTHAIENNWISEVGIYGIYIRKQEQVLLNMGVGYCNRSKPMGYNEGGITLGIGTHDSICLVSQDEYLKSAILPSQVQSTQVTDC